MIVLLTVTPNLALADDACTHELVVTGSGLPELIFWEYASRGHVYRYCLYYSCRLCHIVVAQPLNLTNYPDSVFRHAFSVLSEDLGHTSAGTHILIYACIDSNCPYTQSREVPCTEDCVHYVNKKPVTDETVTE